ncbi:hypothetical protein M728_005599 (plasmid) [Ensifer sp. WSM1721]
MIDHENVVFMELLSKNGRRRPPEDTRFYVVVQNDIDPIHHLTPAVSL